MRSEIEGREEHLAAESETRCDLYYLCVEVATTQNPPHLSIFLDCGVSNTLQVRDCIGY
jgi:hypothetical protein